MTFKKCVYMYTDMCMCVHVCAHAFGGQGTASSGAPQALSILGLSLAWDLLIQPGWLAREPPGTPFSPVPQLLDRGIYHHGRLIICVFGAQVFMIARQALYQLSHIFSSYVQIGEASGICFLFQSQWLNEKCAFSGSYEFLMSQAWVSWVQLWHSILSWAP